MAETDPLLIKMFPRAPDRRRLWRAVRAGLLLIASALILVVAAYRATRYPSALAIPRVTPITDSREHAAREHDIIGTFATGHTPGDRILLFLPNRHVEFSLIGSADPAFRTTDTWDVGLLDRQPCVITSGSGLIQVVDIDHLQYYGDTYERTKSP